jgi:hypothetical protein
MPGISIARWMRAQLGDSIEVSAIVSVSIRCLIQSFPDLYWRHHSSSAYGACIYDKLTQTRLWPSEVH